MKKHIPLLLTFVTLLAFAGGVYYIHLLTPIITGYAAKNLASGIFVGNRTQESMEAIDLNFSLIKFTTNSVDFEKKEVTSRFLWAQSKAIYIEGFGCTLVREDDENTIRNRPYTIVPLPDFNTDTIKWPAGDKLVDTIPSGINMRKLNKTVDRAFADSAGSKGTFAIAVAYKNQLVVERYKEGLSSKNRFLSWSMSKSFTHALVGIMVKKGLINIDEPCNFTQWQRDGRRAITLRHLMHMNGGQAWSESYGNLSDVNLMLHKYADMGLYSIAKPLAVRPDSQWLYNSGATNIVCYAMRKQFKNESDYYTFPHKELFNPLGMRSAVFEVDASGTFAGSSYIYATMRDYVRFGMLYLNNGNWLGNQILPNNWVAQAREEARGSNGQYGSFFWLNRSGDYPDVPRDLFMCRGHDGQYIYIIPSLQLVVVRTGFSKKGTFDLQVFLASVVKAVEK